MSEPNQAPGDEHREGLSHDLPTLHAKGMVRRPWGRRTLLGLAGGLGAAFVAGCAEEESTGSGGGSTGAPEGGAASGGGPRGGPPSGAPTGPPPGGGGGMPGGESTADLDDGDIPAETAGPYPADGSNGVNVLAESGIVRSDLTRSFGDATGVAEGVPLRIRLKVYDNGADGMTPYAGAAVYLWQCDREGNYSLYSEAVADENYLRGVQEVGRDGSLDFTSIFPACYPGRWPHLHFEVYPSLDDATSARNRLRTSQIAFPEDVCQAVYAKAEGYESSQQTLAGVSLDTDGIFADGHSLQLARVTGSVARGYDLRLNVPV